MQKIATRSNFIELIDANPNASTIYNLSLDQSVKGSISSNGDNDWYAINLVAGQTYSFALIGTGTNYLADPFLKLYNTSGTLLKSDDDNGPGASSFIKFTATTSGVYYIDATGFQSNQGQYGLSFSLGSHPSFDLAMAGGAIHTDATSGIIPTWSAIGSPATVSYGFRESGVAQDAQGHSSVFSQLTSSEIQAVRTILGLWSDVCNVSFNEVNPSGYTNSATMLFGNYISTSDGAGAYANYPGPSGGVADTSYNSTSGDVWLNLDSINPSGITPSSYSFFAIMHEIGHALGLSHPGDYNASPSGNITYSNSAQFIQDSQMYSVMSYFGGTENGQNPGDFAIAYTPMMADIYEIQMLYGANLLTRTSDTIYGFLNNTGSDIYSFNNSNTPLFCIWDGGGIDTLNCSGFNQNQNIDLGDGSFSNIGGGTSNVSIALGAMIEDAVGGSGQDTITGNNLNNTLMGSAGNDTLIGGFGNDTALYSGNFNEYVVNASGNSFIIQDSRSGSPDGIDTLTSIENIQFLDQTYNLIPSDNEAPSLLSFLPNDNASNVSVNSNIVLTFSEAVKFGSGTITIHAGSASGTVIETYNVGSPGSNLSISSNTLTINPTNDLGYSTDYYVTFDSGAITDLSNNAYTGTTTYDFVTQDLPPHLIVGSSGNDILSGSEANDTLNGLAGNDNLDGGLGADFMIGGTGNDTFIVDNTSDVVIENATEGSDNIQTSISYTLSANVENLTLTGSSNFNGTGNDLNNLIIGNSGNNILDGNLGSDTLNGGLGDDQYNVIRSQGNKTINDTGGIDTLQITELVGLGYGDGGYMMDVKRGGTGNKSLIGTVTLGSTPVQTITVANEFNGANLGAGAIEQIHLINPELDFTYNVLPGLIGTSGNDFIVGFSTNDIIIGNGGNDVLIGGAGNDTITAGASGTDILNGGIGIDTFNIQSGTQIISDVGRGGADIINISSGAIAEIEIAAAWTATSSSVNRGTASIMTHGYAVNLAADTLSGSYGFSILNVAGAAKLTGSGLDDTITGGIGKDTIIGGGGDDSIIGGLGNDSLTGGLGSDHFVFNTALNATTNKDTLTDFSSTQGDKIDLSSSIFGNLVHTGSTLNDSDFKIINATPTNANNLGAHLIFNAVNHGLYYDADGSGSGSAIWFATLSTVNNSSQIHASDFVVV